MKWPDDYLIPDIEPFHVEEAGIIYCGRAEEILPLLKFNVLVSDPPYGINHLCDYQDRGRGNLAKCSNYNNIIGDDTPFNPDFILKLNKPTCLWGANYFADKLPVKSGWLVWDKKRPDDLCQSTAELAWTFTIFRDSIWQSFSDGHWECRNCWLK